MKTTGWSGSRTGIVLLTALLVFTALGGCAAFEKCGLSGCPGDAAITAAVQTTFQQHAELEPPNMITVQTVDGVVYLYGLVETDYQRQMAESVAHQTAGVNKVVNSIGLSGNAR